MRKGLKLLVAAGLMLAAGRGMQAQSCEGKIEVDIRQEPTLEAKNTIVPLLKVRNLTHDDMKFDVSFVNFHPAKKAILGLPLSKDGAYSQMLGGRVSGETATLATKPKTRTPYVYVHGCVVARAK